MRRHFTDAEIVEISMAAALFNMINRLNREGCPVAGVDRLDC